MPRKLRTSRWHILKILSSEINSLKQSKHSPYLFGCTKMLKASVANVKKGLGAIVRRALNERQYWIDWVRIEPGGPTLQRSLSAHRQPSCVVQHTSRVSADGEWPLSPQPHKRLADAANSHFPPTATVTCGPTASLSAVLPQSQPLAACPQPGARLAPSPVLVAKPYSRAARPQFALDRDDM